MTRVQERVQELIRQASLNDGRVDETEWRQIDEALRGDTTLAADDRELWQARSAELGDLMRTGVQPTPGEAFDAQLSRIVDGLPDEAAQLQEMEARLATLEEGQEKQALESQIAAMRGLLDGKMQRASELAQLLNRTADLPEPVYAMMGEEIPGREESSSGLSMTARAMTAQGSGAASQGKGQVAAITLPPSWGAQVTGPEFPSGAYLQSLAADAQVQNSFDEVLNNRQRGRQLMQAFYYFAKRAASGDLQAMTNLVKFCGFIIGKDKSNQMIGISQKLIQLQDEARRVQDVITNTKSDAANPNSNNEFMKVMTWGKSQSDAIAMSQKLLVQMLEEFSQVVETLTTASKSMQDATGRNFANLAKW